MRREEARHARADARAGAGDGLGFGLNGQDNDDGIRYGEEPGTPNPFLVYGHPGEPCRSCGTSIRQSTQGGRSTYFCPKCQPLKPARKAR